MSTIGGCYWFDLVWQYASKSVPRSQSVPRRMTEKPVTRSPRSKTLMLFSLIKIQTREYNSMNFDFHGKLFIFKCIDWRPWRATRSNKPVAAIDKIGSQPTRLDDFILQLFKMADLNVDILALGEVIGPKSTRSQLQTQTVILNRLRWRQLFYDTRTIEISLP